MNVARAFDIRRKEVVAFVGGGGKTTAMFCLADELVAQGKRVITTTTTRIFAAQIQLAPKHVAVESREQALGDARSALGETPHVLVIGATKQEGKAFGVEPRLVDELGALEQVDVVLVEADGSRMRSFKAPAEHEPVIPHSTTLLVPVVGIDAVGKILSDEYVHRAELVSQIADIPLGTILQSEHIARVLGERRGGLKNRPRTARVIPLINKVENAEQLAHARNIAASLLQNDEIESVAMGAVKNRRAPISMLESRVTAVVLAAGGSTRMRGAVKQLLPWGDTTFVGNAVRVAKNSRVREIVVVTGHQAEQVKKEIRKLGEIKVAHNPDWATGRASSVRLGIQNTSANSGAAIFINADQPFLAPQVIDAVIEKFFETRAPMVVPMFDGKTGSPVLFARELFWELNALQGEQGGRDVLQKYREVLARVDIADARAALDLDTPEEYDTAKRMMR